MRRISLATAILTMACTPSPSPRPPPPPASPVSAEAPPPRDALVVGTPCASWGTTSVAAVLSDSTVVLSHTLTATPGISRWFDIIDVEAAAVRRRFPLPAWGAQVARDGDFLLFESCDQEMDCLWSAADDTFRRIPAAPEGKHNVLKWTGEVEVQDKRPSSPGMDASVDRENGKQVLRLGSGESTKKLELVSCNYELQRTGDFHLVSTFAPDAPPPVTIAPVAGEPRPLYPKIPLSQSDTNREESEACGGQLMVQPPGGKAVPFKGPIGAIDGRILVSRKSGLVALDGAEGNIRWAARSPDGRYLALANKLWSCDTGKATVLGELFNPTAVFTPDSRFVAVNTCSATDNDDLEPCGVALWDLTKMTRRVLRKDPQQMMGGAFGMLVIADGRLLLDGVGLFDPSTDRLVWKTSSNFFSVSPNGRLVAASFASASERERVRVLRMSDGVSVFADPKAYFGAWWVGDYFITKDKQDRAHAYHRADWKEVATSPPALFVGAAFDGRALVFDDGGRLGIMRLADGALAYRFDAIGAGFISYTPDGRYFFSTEDALRRGARVRAPGDVRWSPLEEVSPTDSRRQSVDLFVQLMRASVHP